MIKTYFERVLKAEVANNMLGKVVENNTYGLFLIAIAIGYLADVLAEGLSSFTSIVRHR